jgi:hypothetical protein
VLDYFTICIQKEFPVIQFPGLFWDQQQMWRRAPEGARTEMPCCFNLFSGSRVFLISRAAGAPTELF